MLCLMLLHHSIFPAEREKRASISATVRQVLLGSQVEHNKRARSCFLVDIGLLCVCFVLKREMNFLEAIKAFWLSDASRRRWSVKLHLFRAGSVAVSREEGRSHLAHRTLHSLE